MSVLPGAATCRMVVAVVISTMSRGRRRMGPFTFKKACKHTATAGAICSYYVLVRPWLGHAAVSAHV